MKLIMKDANNVPIGTWNDVCVYESVIEISVKTLGNKEHIKKKYI